MDNTLVALPKVRLGEWISEGWNMFAEEWKVWVLNALVLSGATVVPVVAAYVFFFVVAAASPRGAGAGLGVAMLGLIFVVAIVVILVNALLVGGMYNTAFKQLRGERISVGDMFSAGDRALSVLGAAILVGILTMIGMMLCVIPAFIVGGALFFTLPLVVERRLSVGDAIQTSREATRGDLFMFVLFALIVTLIAQAGSYLCYIGLLVTLPLQFTIAAIAYRDCFGVPGARSFVGKAGPTHAYGAPPPSGYQPAPPQQWSGYGTPIAQAPPATSPQPPPITAVQSGPTGDLTRCPDCQAELPATARFCARCGRSLIQT